MPANRLASIVFPDPGGPIIRTLWTDIGRTGIPFILRVEAWKKAS
jgi:hypothetical protein